MKLILWFVLSFGLDTCSADSETTQEYKNRERRNTSPKNSSVGTRSPSVEDGPESSSPFPAKKSMLILTYSIFCTGKDKKTPIKSKYIQLYIPTPFPQNLGSLIPFLVTFRR